MEKKGLASHIDGEVNFKTINSLVEAWWSNNIVVVGGVGGGG